MLHDILRDRFDQRVVADGLNEDRAVVVPRRRRHVDLQCELQILLQQLVVDVLNRFEPRQLVVVDMVRLIIEDGEFVDLAHDLAKIDMAVGGLSRRAVAERRQEIVRQVLIVERRFGDFAKIDPVDVGEEDVSRRADDAHVILNVERNLEIVAPILAGITVIRQHRVAEENAQAVEVRPEAVEHDDVRRDEKEIPRERRARLIELVEVAPRHEEREHLGLSGPGRHFHDEARPGLIEHVRRNGARRVEPYQVMTVADAADVVEPDDGFDGLALREVIAKGALRSVGVFDKMIGLEPPVEQRLGSRRGADIAACPPLVDFLPDVGDQRREKFGVVFPKFLGGREPPDLRVKFLIGGGWEFRV